MLRGRTGQGGNPLGGTQEGEFPSPDWLIRLFGLDRTRPHLKRLGCCYNNNSSNKYVLVYR